MSSAETFGCWYKTRSTGGLRAEKLLDLHRDERVELQDCGCRTRWMVLVSLICNQKREEFKWELLGKIKLSLRIYLFLPAK